MGANRGIRNVQLVLGAELDSDNKQPETALFKGQEQ